MKSFSLTRSFTKDTVIILRIILILSVSLYACQVNGGGSVPPVFDNPYQNYQFWYKGNTHTHTNDSGDDGELTVDQVAAVYAQQHYDFLAITHHNNAKLGWQNPEPLLLVNGCESNDWYENHLVALGVDYYCPSECRSCSVPSQINTSCSISTDQRRVDQALNQGGLAILAHPSDRSGSCWGQAIERGWSFQKLDYVQRYHAVEIVSGDNISMKEWKFLLDLGRKVWGVASDDFHEGSPGKGWIVVNSDKKPIDRNDILKNIANGNFYSVKRGNEAWPAPEITSIVTNQVTVTISGKVYDPGGAIVSFIDASGWALKETRTGSSGPFSVSYSAISGYDPMPAGYLRIEVENLGSWRPLTPNVRSVVYSQPLFVNVSSFWSGATASGARNAHFENLAAVTCPSGKLLSGVRCEGDYCGLIRLRCSANTFDFASSEWTPAPGISEERPNNFLVCGADAFVTGMECSGNNCDNIRVECSTVGGRKRTDCYWTNETVSEEDGGILIFPTGYYAAGINCIGSYCDNMQFYLCRAI